MAYGAVVSPHIGIGHGHRTVEDLHLRKARRHFSAGRNQRGSGGENHLRSVFDGSFHRFFRRFAGSDTHKTLYDDLLAHDSLQVLSARLMGTDPVAVFRHQFVDKRHIQIGSHDRKSAAALELCFAGSVGLRIHLNDVSLPDGLDIRPDSLETA